MLTLHIANKNYSSWSLRPWLLMKVLEIPFAEQMHPFGEIFSFSPTRRVPCLVDGDVTIWDSLAITEYLAEHYSQVWPRDLVARAWARSATAEMHSGFSELRNICSMSCGQRVELAAIPPALADDIARLDALWSEGLWRFGGPFLAGKEFSAVDAFYAPVAFRIQTYGLKLGDAASAYVQRLLELPAMRDWYASALAETWREDAHETSIAAHGRISADFRSPES
ncbi:glutathione S-transferase family protein [Solilutibacter silvestris]|uniref:Glutathione S-transferase n=1 Tax=Solilutibacter silvestris TaxID=1645665 RepID=A0A2K1PZ98_9GAMM|nr:glutathione S-transferase family protein [Lysobacter silvestris]PNS08115.1 Glutathione S-transferase [Lysobacter silvestris]